METQQAEETKKCPKCKEDIKKDAALCKHCRTVAVSPQREKAGIGCLALLGIFVIYLVIVSSGKDKKVEPTKVIKSETSIIQEDPAVKLAREETKKKAAEEKVAKDLADQKAWEKTKAGKICTSHPLWIKEECIKLADDKIWIGMTYNMLVYERGKPNSINPSSYGGETKYQYCWYDYTPSCFYDNNNDDEMDAFN